MNKKDQTWLIIGVFFIASVFLYLLSIEQPDLSMLMRFFLKFSNRVLYIIGGLFLLGLIRYSDAALRYTVGLLTILLFLINLGLYFTSLNSSY